MILDLFAAPSTRERSRRLLACRCIVLGMFLFLGSLDCAAQEIIVAGSERSKTTQRNPPEAKQARSKPAPSRPALSRPAQPRQVMYFDLNITPDEDCLLTIDGVMQKDTLRAGITTSKKLTSGTHRLSAESIATGYVHSEQVKVDAGNRNIFEIPIKQQFEAHMKRVETALTQQQ